MVDLLSTGGPPGESRAAGPGHDAARGRGEQRAGRPRRGDRHLPPGARRAQPDGREARGRARLGAPGHRAGHQRGAPGRGAAHRQQHEPRALPRPGGHRRPLDRPVGLLAGADGRGRARRRALQAGTEAQEQGRGAGLL